MNRPLSSFSVLVALSLQSPAAVIDTFASGGQAIAWPPIQGAVAVTSEVPVVGGLFDTRFLYFRSGGTQSLTVTTSEQILEYALGSDGGGYFQFGYRSASPVNLLGDGASSLRFHFEGATAGTRFPANLYLATASGQAAYSWGFALTDIFNGNDDSFIVDVPLAQFRGGDLTQVTELTFDALRITAGGGFRLSKIETVPEPAAPILFLFGAIPFVLRRSRKR
jgi:hypothetical protein